MPFDPEGTEPGSSPTPYNPNTIHLKCPRDNCASTMATELTPKDPSNPGGVPHSRTYQCTKCQWTWSLNTGGFVNF
jgi:hypothetical protein